MLMHEREQFVHIITPAKHISGLRKMLRGSLQRLESDVINGCVVFLPGGMDV